MNYSITYILYVLGITNNNKKRSLKIKEVFGCLGFLVSKFQGFHDPVLPKSLSCVLEDVDPIFTICKKTI